jgi:hypothetical protein
MVRIVDFSPSSQAANLAALKERRASLDQAMVDNLKPQEMRSPWQGAAQLAQSAMLGLRQGNIARQEAGSRAELARIAAGIDPNTGPTMEQAAQIGAIDTDWGKALMEGALKSRQDAAAREAGYKHDIAMQEDTQAEGRDTLAATQGFTAGQNQQDRDARIAEANARVDAEIAAATTENERTVLENQRQERVAAEVAAQEAKTKAAEPQTDVGKLRADLDAGRITQAEFDAKMAKETQLTATKPADAFTPGQKTVDEKFAPEVLDWDMSGGPNATKAIVQTSKALDILGKNRGSWLQGTGPVTALIPEWGQKFVNQPGITARDAVRDTVQTTLRQVLGSQFTEKEGAALMDRAFDPGVDEVENIRRVKLLMNQVAGIAANKQQMVDYFKKNGTLTGYTGAPIDTAALASMSFDEPNAGGGGGDDADQEGDTATGPNGEKMVFKNGQWVRQ